MQNALLKLKDQQVSAKERHAEALKALAAFQRELAATAAADGNATPPATAPLDHPAGPTFHAMGDGYSPVETPPPAEPQATEAMVVSDDESTSELDGQELIAAFNRVGGRRPAPSPPRSPPDSISSAELVFEASGADALAKRPRCDDAPPDPAGAAAGPLGIQPQRATVYEVDLPHSHAAPREVPASPRQPDAAAAAAPVRPRRNVWA
eukprot:11194290-Lingulodinium_polyedra.AAC.1